MVLAATMTCKEHRTRTPRTPRLQCGDTMGGAFLISRKVGGPGLQGRQEGGRKQKQENRMGGRGPGLKTLTDLVQEGCNRRNRKGPPHQGLEDLTGHPDLR